MSNHPWWIWDLTENGYLADPCPGCGEAVGGMEVINDPTPYALWPCGHGVDRFWVRIEGGDDGPPRVWFTKPEWWEGP